MDFFNKIGSKITETGQGLQEQTKQLTEATKLNNNIANNMKTLDNFYKELGMLYFQSLNGEPSKLGVDIFNNINELNEENEKLKETLSVIKGIVYCPNCNAEAPNTANCCSSCGCQLIKNKPNLSTCSNCGAEIIPNVKFCTGCGSAVQGNN